MSLLMEALKKAEEAKRLGSEDQPEPLSATAPATSSTPHGEQQPPRAKGHSPSPAHSPQALGVNADRLSVSNARHAASPATSPRDTAERTAARNLFAAKLASPRSNTTLWLFGVAVILAALGLGGYFWWQLHGIPSHSLTRPTAPAPATTPASPLTAAAVGGDDARLQPPPSLAAIPAPAAGRSVAATPSDSTPPPARRESNPYAPTAAGSAARPQREPGDTGVRLSRTPPRTDTTLERAYDTLQTGRLDDAQRDYEQVLRGDAKNTDALLGLATIAAQRGQIEQAQAYYLRALETNPNDATAQAGVISTRTQADADASESRLKTALASQPDSPALLVALGNLYARQGRWSEAQQVYFRVYATEPDNPDFIFNLAVSLDHLRQNKLASQYYQMALTAGETRALSFDRNQARNRLLELQP